jgi:hypothetical protein
MGDKSDHPRVQSKGCKDRHVMLPPEVLAITRTYRQSAGYFPAHGWKASHDAQVEPLHKMAKAAGINP